MEKCNKDFFSVEKIPSGIILRKFGIDEVDYVIYAFVILRLLGIYKKSF